MTTDLDRLREALPPLLKFMTELSKSLRSSDHGEPAWAPGSGYAHALATASDKLVAAVQAALAPKQAAPADGAKVADAEIKALYVADHGSEEGWLGLPGSYYISGVQAGRRESRLLAAGGAQATAPVERDFHCPLCEGWFRMSFDVPAAISTPAGAVGQGGYADPAAKIGDEWVDGTWVAKVGAPTPGAEPLSREPGCNINTNDRTQTVFGTDTLGAYPDGFAAPEAEVGAALPQLDGTDPLDQLVLNVQRAKQRFDNAASINVAGATAERRDAIEIEYHRAQGALFAAERALRQVKERS